ncbi:formylmethanofuran dehydrogenase subunit B [Rhodopirellula sallentina]|uniref:Formylmethanofuran dehydrogenase, subunit B n=1 Tax=Rhodopirellula sallentina SM41 TaxID=1263870 RepID=M5U9K6_9BACT|nr:formylmethanofuran dehydrogenase subunit B [Rhodopirellula sallentina]EMI57984.1 formylmethanofuran dehydrogenase, subunit B [Rhodopirellula sallentina SM41]
MTQTNPSVSKPPPVAQGPIVCPLCPLMCDDVSVSKDGELIANSCPIVDQFNASRPRQNRLPAEGVRLPSTEPLRIVTTGVDLATARQLTDWQSQGKVHVELETDASLHALQQTISRDGIVSATLADVATHADMVWMIGGITEAWPRLPEKLRRPGGDDCVPSHSNCSADDLANLSALLHVIGASEDDHGLESTGTTDAAGDFGSLARRWKSAKYAAVIVGPNAFMPGEESISATMLCRIIRAQNTDARCVLMTLDSGATLRSVSMWKTNTSPDSTITSSSLQSFDIRIGSPLKRDSRPATLQIGGIDPGPDTASSYQASSTAGLDRPGMSIRGDGSVSLPLLSSTESRHPTPCEIIDRLLQKN